MAKREYTVNVQCIHPDCKEWGHYGYSTRKEQSKGYERHNRKWKCMRHTNPNTLLTLDLLKTKVKLKCIQKEHGKYWQSEIDFGSESCISGFQFGNGYKAYADDFPEGTILTISTKITLPK